MKNSYLSLIFIFLFTSLSLQAQLTGISPNTGVVNQANLQTSITANGIFQTSLSPEGNIYEIYLQKGTDNIPVFSYWNWQWNVNVINPDSATALFSIPVNAVPGVYDLHVNTQDLNFPGSANAFYTLPAAFTIAPPDGYVSGTAFLDANGNGLMDAGESVLSSQAIRITPGNITVYTNASGYFSYPLTNGNYTLTYLPGGTAYVPTSGMYSFPLVINNANVPNFDFPLMHGLSAVSPTRVYKGQTVSMILYSRGIFATGVNSWGNISILSLTGPGSYTIPSNKITVLDSNRAHIVFTVPFTTTGIYNFRASVIYNGGLRDYYLNNALSIEPAPSILSGTAYYDANQNGTLDVGEPPLPYIRFYLDPDSQYTFSNSAGYYEFGATLGTHTITPSNPPATWAVTSAPSYTFTNTGNMSGFDFGFYSNYPDYTCSILFTRAFLRCFQPSIHTLTYSNLSNVVAQGTVYLVHHNTTYNNAAPVPSSINLDTLFWNFSGLQPMETRTIQVSLTNPPGGSGVGFYSGIIVRDGSGITQFQDTIANSGITACAYDPNDKSVTPPTGDDLEHYTLFSDTLDYLIRFQNTGNDTALTVFIRDTIDIALDLSTLELVAASHNVQVEVDSNRALTFRFNNIMLPDSIVDEPGSHGFVRYRIRPMPSLPDPTRVENTAYIYFDFNAPVQTNTTWNTLTNFIPTSVQSPVKADRSVMFYPNPMEQSGIFSFTNSNAEPVKIEVFDATGKQVINGSTRASTFELKRNRLPSGVYSYRISNLIQGDVHYGKIVIQ